MQKSFREMSYEELLSYSERAAMFQYPHGPFPSSQDRWNADGANAELQRRQAMIDQAIKEGE